MMTQLFNISLLIACPAPAQQQMEPLVAPTPAVESNIAESDSSNDELQLQTPPNVIIDGIDFNQRMLNKIKGIA